MIHVILAVSLILQLRSVRVLVQSVRLSRTRYRRLSGKYRFLMDISEPAEQSIGTGIMGIAIVGQNGATGK